MHRAKTPLAIVLSLTASLALTSAAFAGSGNAGSSSLDRYAKFAGEPVPSFLLRDFRNWELLDREHLVVHATHRESWLISVQSPCRGLDEAWKVSIGETGTRIYANSGILRFDSGSCRIDTIREIDMGQLRAAGGASARAG